MNNASAANLSKENGSGFSMKSVPSKAEGIVWCSVFALLSVFIVVGNLLTIVLFAVNKKLRKKSLFLVINMAFADLLLGALSLPLYVYIDLGMDYYQLWSESMNMPILYLFAIADSVSMIASLISAAFISCERFYAIYWPFKHRNLTVRTYRIVILIVWTLALLHTGLVFMKLGKLYMHIFIPFALTPTIIICGCNIAIWIKFQQGSIAGSEQQNRDAQNERLTKTLMFVPILALLCWLPLIIVSGLGWLYFVIPWRYLVITSFLNYSNACVNPVAYALRIPEFRQALTLCCARKREAIKTQNTLRLETTKQSCFDAGDTAKNVTNDCNNLQLKVDEESMNTGKQTSKL